MKLYLRTYIQITQVFPKEEIYGIHLKCVRAAVSILEHSRRLYEEGMTKSLFSFYIYLWVQLLS